MESLELQYREYNINEGFSYVNIERNKNILGRLYFEYDTKEERVYLHLEKFIARAPISIIKYVVKYVNYLALFWNEIYAAVPDCDHKMVELLKFTGFTRTEEKRHGEPVWVLKKEK